MTTLRSTPDPDKRPSIKDKASQRFGLSIVLNSTDSASNALEYAFHLAMAYDWDMHLLHLIDVEQLPESGNPVTMSRILSQEHRRSASRLESYKEIIECNGIKVTVAEPVIVGVFQLDALQEYMRKIGPDLVMVGRDSFSRGVLKAVVTETKTPVMIVPESRFKRKPSSLLLFSDGRRQKENDLYPMLGFAARTNQQVSVLSMIKRKKFGRRKFQSYLPSSTGTTFVNFYQQEGMDAVNTIEKFVHNKSFDIVAVILRDHTWIRRLFYRWSFVDLASRVDVPLLVFKGR